MYTTDCKDADCYKCKQTSKGQTSGEETQCKFAKTVGELISAELLLASTEKAACLETYRKLKDEIHSQINGLVDILRENERSLCMHLEREYETQVTKIDHDVTAKCINKLLKKNDELEKTPDKFQLVFHSDFDVLKRKLQNFGFLSYEHISEFVKRELPKGHETWVNLENSQKTLVQETAFSDYILELDFKIASSTEKNSPTIFTNPLVVSSEATPISTENEEKMLGGEIIKIEKECPKTANLKSKDENTSDEEDIEFINSIEVVNLPSFSIVLPPAPANLFSSKKYSCFDSFLPEKGAFFSKKDSTSESSGFNESEYDGCSVALRSSVSSGSNTENASYNEQAEQEFCSFVPFNKDQDNNPSAALLSSLMKYLEKSPESEWLAPEKSSEQWLSPGNNCISYKPFVDKKDIDLNEWLSKSNNTDIISDWLSCNHITKNA